MFGQLMHGQAESDADEEYVSDAEESEVDDDDNDDYEPVRSPMVPDPPSSSLTYARTSYVSRESLHYSLPTRVHAHSENCALQRPMLTLVAPLMMMVTRKRTVGGSCASVFPRFLRCFLLPSHCSSGAFAIGPLCGKEQVEVSYSPKPPRDGL